MRDDPQGFRGSREATLRWSPLFKRDTWITRAATRGQAAEEVTEMKKLILSAAILATAAHAANCPMSECNYLDPQYQAALKAYMKCAEPLADAFDHAMKQLAVVYPKFGIAWQTQLAEEESATADPGNSRMQEESDEAHRRFEDRILRTAEPEALQFYNLWKLKVKREVERCPPMPQPPRGPPSQR
jgi:hypothetical protein